MQSIKKLKLKVDKAKKIKMVLPDGDNLYFSGFCLTDNVNFSEFYIKKIPDLKKKYFSFDFDEKDMVYNLGKEIKKEEIENKVSNIHFNYFIKKYENSKFFLLESFLNNKTSDSVGIVKEDKLVGILKIKENENGKVCIQEKG